MKEKISKLANEEFEYELPKLILSERCLTFQAEKNKEIKKVLEITNSENKHIKGYVCCNSPYVTLSKVNFEGIKAEIELKVLVRDQEVGNKIEDKLIFVTDCGERDLAVEIQVVEHFYDTSMGKIKDLFHFANLAKTNSAEAVMLFKALEFERIFLKNKRERILYHCLLKGNSSQQAMEEFLVAIHKKLKILISVEKTELFYGIKDEKPFQDKLLIKKDNWGYCELKLSTNVDFLTLEHKRIWSDDFAANKYELEYVIDPSKMRFGKNFGRIFISTPYQEFEIDVTAVRAREDKKERELRLLRKKGILKLIENYISFRINYSTRQFFISETDNILKEQGNLIEADSTLLLTYYLYVIKEDINRIEECKSKIEQKLLLWEIENTDYYCAALYLRAFQTKKAEDISLAVEKIGQIYEREETFEYLWYLLYLDDSYDDKKIRESILLEQLDKGINSPILYYEIISYYNKYPTSLKEITKELIKVFHWGIKMNYIQYDLMLQYVLLVRKISAFKRIIYKDLSSLYYKYKTDEILHTICSMLIRNEKADKEYFNWYQLGVERQLRITNLYEYYLYSCDEDTVELPISLLLYFNYDSNLSYRKRAFLYRYLIQNKVKYRAVFEQYEHRILHFTKTQLGKKNQDGNLFVLYENYIEQNGIPENLYEQVSELMFQYEIECENKKMQGVIVTHKEIEKDVYVPLTKGKGVITIYTEQPCIIFVDEKGGRYANTISYKLHKCSDLEKYDKACYEGKSKNQMLLLHLYEKIEQYQKEEEAQEQICKEVLSISSLNHFYHKNVLMGLMNEYYERMDYSALGTILDEIKLEELDFKERIQVIETCAIYDREQKALEGIEQYGFHGIRSNRLLRLIGKWIQEREEEKNDFILMLSKNVFDMEKYNEEVLRYLIKYFNGSSKEMYHLWEKAQSFEVDAGVLEERLLTQVLFTEHCSQKYFKVFLSYYEKEKNSLLIHAFLSFYSYRYIVHDRILHDRFFYVLEEECHYRESQIGCLALLKYYSGLKELNEEQIRFVDYTMYQMIEKGIIFPFFSDFKNKMPVPHKIQDKFYVEYKCNPKKKVKICYQLEGQNENEFVAEMMKPVYSGIFVKEFVLFYNETLQYYITEEDWEDKKEEAEKEIKITESVSAVIDKLADVKEETSYNLINIMLMTKEMQDEKTLLEIMKYYVQLSYVGSQLFKPI